MPGFYIGISKTNWKNCQQLNTVNCQKANGPIGQCFPYGKCMVFPEASICESTGMHVKLWTYMFWDVIHLSLVIDNGHNI